jgi:integrase
MKPYPEQDGKRVWLSVEEIQKLIDESESTEQERAFKFASRCGLRRKEITQITPADLVTDEKGHYHLRVWEDVAKKGHYREPPVPDILASKLEAVEDLNSLAKRDEFVSVHGKTV